MRLSEMDALNARAMEARPWVADGYAFRPVSAHDPELHELKQQHPYFGYIEAEVTGVRPFVMLSNNDDVVAQIYFWFGPDSYESLSLRVWRRMARESDLVLDVGAYTGLFTLVASFANPDAEVHAFEPNPPAYLRLLGNLAVNRLGRRVVTHQEAASDQAGEAILHGFQGELSLTTGSSLIEKQGKAVEQRHRVRTRRLDDVVAAAERRVAVKIDAEEVEDRVLVGLERIIASAPTSLLVEVASVELLEACLDRLPGYTFAVLHDTEHRAMVEDRALLEQRDAIRRGASGATGRVDPPNVLFRRGPADALWGWLAPLVDEVPRESVS